MHSITLVIPSLGLGGAERVMACLANSWASKGVRVTLISLLSDISDHYYLDPSIRRVTLPFRSGKRRTFTSSFEDNLSRALALRTAIRAANSGLTLSFIDSTNVLVLFATILMRERIFVSERACLAATSARLGKPWKFLRRILYRRAQQVIVQTPAEAREVTRLGLAKEAAVLPNPLSPELLPLPAALSDISPPHIIAMGRLVFQKGFDLLIRAFARVSQRHPDARLVIWGDGEEREALCDLIRSFDLTDRVSLPGITPDPWSEIRKGTAFVLSSRFEGFPNVLLESIALGVPSISFDCPHGPSVISDAGETAVLVPPEDVVSLASAICKVIEEKSLRESLHAKAASIRAQYAPHSIVSQWETVLRVNFSAPRG